MRVSDVEVENAATGRDQRFDLPTESHEVGRVQRRLYLEVVPDPVAPAHPPILRSTATRVREGVR